MKLQFLVPQWKEDESIIKNLLDSIKNQQGIDLKDIGVIIMNDGSDVILSDDFLNSYPFKIDYYLSKHGGVSKMRNQCLLAATADYVMFCDADDMFFNNCGIFTIFKSIEQSNFDVLISTFSEEIYQNNKFNYINHTNDSTFVHGKVFNRNFLLENNLFWKEELTVHEDSYFNFLCRVCAKPEKVAYCNDVFYLWKYRANSVCRNDEKYLLKTLPYLIDSMDYLIKELLFRGKMSNASFVATSFIFNTYYDLNEEMWNKKENKKYLNIFMKRFVKFYDEYNSMMELMNKDEKTSLLIGIKKEKINKGIILEKFTYEQWINSFDKYR